MSRLTVKKIMDHVEVVRDGQKSMVSMEAHKLERLLALHIHDTPLRDGLAKAALQGLLAGDASWSDHEFKPINGLSQKQNTAVLAYLYADAMLKAREMGQ